MANCHHGWKTAKSAEYAINHDFVCDDCGGDIRKPTGEKYINPSIP